MALYEAFIRYYKEEIVDKQAEDIKLIVRDVRDYLALPVIARINVDSNEGTDQIWILDPLGRRRTSQPAGIKILKVEDEDKLLDVEFHKASSQH